MINSKKKKNVVIRKRNFYYFHLTYITLNESNVFLKTLEDFYLYLWRGRVFVRKPRNSVKLESFLTRVDVPSQPSIPFPLAAIITENSISR